MGVIAKNTEDYISFSVNVEVDKCINKNGEDKISNYGSLINTKLIV